MFQYVFVQKCTLGTDFTLYNDNILPSCPTTGLQIETRKIPCGFNPTISIRYFAFYNEPIKCAVSVRFLESKSSVRSLDVTHVRTLGPRKPNGYPPNRFCTRLDHARLGMATIKVTLIVFIVRCIERRTLNADVSSIFIRRCYFSDDTSRLSILKSSILNIRTVLWRKKINDFPCYPPN